MVSNLYRFRDLDTSPGLGARPSQSTSEPSPGRFYIAVVLKTILAHILRRYEFRLVNEKASRTFYWRATIIPRRSAKLLMRDREVGGMQ